MEAPLRFLFAPAPPWIYACAFDSKLAQTAKCAYPGATAEMVHLILKVAHVNYELVKGVCFFLSSSLCSGVFDVC